MNLSMDSEEFVVSGKTYQINRVNTTSMYVFWLIAKTSTWFLPKLHGSWHSCTGITRDLVPSVSGTSRNITTDNYYTSIRLAMELKSQKLTFVGTINKNKACIVSFLAKADEGTVQNAFDHTNNFTLVRCFKEKQEGLLPVQYAFRKKERRGYWKK